VIVDEFRHSAIVAHGRYRGSGFSLELRQSRCDP
jgi:hypothetical protein